MHLVSASCTPLSRCEDYVGSAPATHCIARRYWKNLGDAGPQLTYEARRFGTVPQSLQTIRRPAGIRPSTERTEPLCWRVPPPWKAPLQ